MNVKFVSIEHGYDMEGRIIAFYEDGRKIIVLANNMHQAVPIKDVISTNEPVEIDGKKYFKLGQSRVSADMIFDPDSKDIHYRIDKDLVKREIPELLDDAILEGKLLAIAECKKMWGEGTLSLNQMIELEDHYKQYRKQ